MVTVVEALDALHDEYPHCATCGRRFTPNEIVGGICFRCGTLVDSQPRY